MQNELSTITVDDVLSATNKKGSNASLSLKQLNRVHNEVTHHVTVLSQREVDIKEEIKDLSNEIKQLTADLNARKKELKIELKSIDKKKLLLFGGLNQVQMQLKDLGVKVKSLDLTKLLPEFSNGGKK